MSDYCNLGQPMRSEKERALPEWARNELDMARIGYDLFGNKISEDRARSIIAMWLGDGR